MGNGLEPYTGQELQAWLTRRGFTVHHQTGDHVHYMAPDGTIVPAGNARSDQHVTKPMADRLAAHFGQNAKWLRDQLGYGAIRRAGGGRPIPPPPDARERGLRSINKLAHLAHGLNRDRALIEINQNQADRLNTVTVLLSRLNDEVRRKTA